MNTLSVGYAESSDMLYVVTVRYGKERVAELEIGDAVFPYDPGVRVTRTEFGGVLLLDTALDHDQLIRVLSVFPPVNVERIVPVKACCGVGELTSCLNRLLSDLGSAISVRLGRKGGIPDDIIKELEAMRRKGGEVTVHIEPVSRELVCVGVTEAGRDRFYLVRRKRMAQENKG